VVLPAVFADAERRPVAGHAALAANTAAGYNEWAATGGSEMFFHVGFAARNGLTAADLAASGAYVSPTALEGPAGLLAAFDKRPRALAARRVRRFDRALRGLLQARPGVQLRADARARRARDRARDAARPGRDRPRRRARHARRRGLSGCDALPISSAAERRGVTLQGSDQISETMVH